MQGINKQGNKQVGFIVNAELFDRAIAASKANPEAPAVSVALRDAVIAFVETWEVKPKAKPSRSRTPRKAAEKEAVSA